VRGEFADPYSYPGTDVLRNKLGIRDQATLSQKEYELSSVRILELRESPLRGRFDLKHLQAIHEFVFQDVYEWAGQLRTINISKGTTSFAAADRIESYGDKVLKTLASEQYLVGLDKVNFVERLAHFYAEWNSLHPFREGNGRATREFIAELSRNAGYELDQTRIDNQKGQWNFAAQRSFHADLGPIAKVFMASIRPSRAVAFELLSEKDAIARHPELQGAYDGLRLMQTLFNEKYKGNPQAQEYYAISSKHEVLRRLDTGVVLQPTVERNSVLMKQVSMQVSGNLRAPDNDIER
jgi:cell filamentation protein